MSTYRLTYYAVDRCFDVRERAELSRFIFAQAGVKYEDERVDLIEWKKLKPNKSPTGYLPMLEVDGNLLTGSAVIARFLAERFSLAGSNDVENAEIAGIIDVLRDFMLNLVPLFNEDNEELKTQMIAKIEKEEVPKYWGIIEGYYRKNSSANGWIYGDTPTYGDFSIYCASEFVMRYVPNLLQMLPGVTKMRASVEALPRIAEWLKNRPKEELLIL